MNIQAYGFDISKYAISSADPSISQYLTLIDSPDYLISTTQTPFDLSICKDVLEHVPDHILPELVSTFRQTSLKHLAVVPIGTNDSDNEFVISQYHNDPTHITIKSAEWWLKLYESSGYTNIFSSFSLSGVKDNWTNRYPDGNLFIIAS